MKHLGSTALPFLALAAASRPTWVAGASFVAVPAAANQISDRRCRRTTTTAATMAVRNARPYDHDDVDRRRMPSSSRSSSSSSSPSFRIRRMSDDTDDDHDDESIVVPTAPARRIRNRRGFLGDAAARSSGCLVAFAAATTTATTIIAPPPADAAMNSDQTVFKAGKDLTVDEAKARFKEGRESLRYLLDNYDEICEAGGGDNIRRYLGTVGTTSGLYGISKVLKILLENNDAGDVDVVEFRETMEEFNSALVGAEGSAYMSIFTETSTSGVPKEKYFKDAKIEVKRAIVAMKDLADQMNLK